MTTSTPPDPFSRIPIPDSEYSGTVLETTTEREARETGRKRADELFALSDDPNWLGI